jgi:hypothetical protein
VEWLQVGRPSAYGEQRAGLAVAGRDGPGQARGAGPHVQRRGPVVPGVGGRAGEEPQTKRVYQSAHFLTTILERVPVHVIPCIKGRATWIYRRLSSHKGDSANPRSWQNRCTSGRLSDTTRRGSRRRRRASQLFRWRSVNPVSTTAIAEGRPTAHRPGHPRAPRRGRRGRRSLAPGAVRG